MFEKRISIIVVSYNVTEFLELCLDSVYRAIRGMNAEVIVVDNTSSDNSVTMVRELFPEAVVIANTVNLGFSKANNQGLAIAQGEYIHFLNPDAVLPEDFYQKSLSFMDSHPSVGGLGPRIIDAKGKYSVDSKKGFPSFWVSVAKVLGFSKIFPQSKRFNKYYAADVQEYETAAVDILSGCCLLVRKTAIEQSGGGFDERYFMYCEDVDLCYRLTQSGYQNVYFPETTVVHYKGESSRRPSLRHMKIFYEAHALFVKQYYPKRLGYAYNAGLKVVLVLRNIFNYLRHILSIFKLILIDALLLTGTSVLFADFWLSKITPLVKVPERAFYAVLPMCVLLWTVALYYNGAYDKPFSLFRAARGMLWGIVAVLACYGLLPVGYRFSRGIIFFSGMAGAMVLCVARWAFAMMGWIKLLPRGRNDYRSAIVGSETDYNTIKKKLEERNYSLEIDGRISTEPNDAAAIGCISKLHEIQQTLRLNEVIFCAQSVSYKNIFQSLEDCSQNAYFKLVPSGNSVIVGGGSFSKSDSDLFFYSKKYILSTQQSKRNKRVIDIFISLLLLLLFPMIAFRIKKNKWRLLQNAVIVLFGYKTWIGYRSEMKALSHLPLIKPPVLPSYQIVEGYSPDEKMLLILAERYAKEYDSIDDLRFVWNNLPFLNHIAQA